MVNKTRRSKGKGSKAKRRRGVSGKKRATVKRRLTSKKRLASKKRLTGTKRRNTKARRLSKRVRGGGKCPTGYTQNTDGECIKNPPAEKPAEKPEGRYQYNKAQHYAVDDYLSDEHASSGEDWSSNAESGSEDEEDDGEW